MKKNFKKALLVAPAACLALSLGMFAAACNPDTPEPHQHSYTEWAYDAEQHWKYCPDDDAIDEDSYAGHVFNDNDACECGARIDTVTLSAGGAQSVTVDGETKVAFVNSMGSYKLTVNNAGSKSYTFKIGDNEYTVDSQNDSFNFNVLGDSLVHVYQAATDSRTEQDTDLSGVKIIIVPDADYSNGDVKDRILITVESLSTVLVNGNNELTVTDTVIHKYMIVGSSGNFGTYTLNFDIADDDNDEYTVSAAGKTVTVNKDNKEVTFDFTKPAGATDDDDEDLSGGKLAKAADVEKVDGGYVYAITFTPAADNVSDTVKFYLLQPLQERTCNYGSDYGVNINSSSNPELVDYYNGEVSVKVNLGNNDGPFALVGTAYYSDFAVYVGDDKVGEVTGVAAKGESGKALNLTLNLEDSHIVNGYVTLTFKFDCATTKQFNILAGIKEPLEEVDNTKLIIGQTTTCSVDDINADNKYVYTFTASVDGWYKFTFWGSSEFTYAYGNNEPKPFNFPATEVVQLSANDVLSFEISGIPTMGYLTIEVEETVVVEGGDFKLNEKFTTTEDKMSGEFVAETDGTYVILLHDSYGMGVGSYKIAGVETDNGGVDVRKEVTLAAGESVEIEVWYDGIEITVMAVGDFKLNEKFTTTEDKMKGNFIAETAGTYVITLHDSYDMGVGSYKIAGVETDNGGVDVIKEVTLAAGESVEIEVWYDGIEITVTKK